MTTTAVKPRAAAKAVPAKPAPPAVPSRRRGFTPLTPMRAQAAKSMRRLAAQMAAQDPSSPAHQHIRDAARTLESGNEEAAQRHLRAAMFSLTPQSLHRNGAHDDGTHIAARQAMHGAHRHLLLVKDIVDAGAKNQQAIRRDSYGDLESAPVLPHPPFRPDPNAGYGPGALAQKPTARQPGGDRALNAPDRTNSGGSDPAVADPVGPQPKGSKQFARTWGELAGMIDLVGPHGYEHGWIKPGGGILSGPHPADKMTVASDKRSAARSLSDDGLKAAHKELARRAALLGKPGQMSSGHKAVAAEAKARGIKLAYGRDDLASVVELSAETGRLAVTPAPYGKPGGPGLYNVKGNKHSDYEEQIVQALMRKGMDKGKATAIARGSIRRWMVKSKHPEVRAAAAGAEAEELKAQAEAHAHANTWDELAAVIDLASQPRTVDLVGPHGYIHGWIYVGGPGLPSVAAHNAALRSKGVTPPTKAHPALTRKPPGVKAAAPAAKAPAPVSKAAPAVAPKAAVKPPEPPEAPLPAEAQAAEPTAADEAAGKLVDGLNMMSSLGGKSTQKAILKTKRSLDELHAMDAEYTRRGSASGKIAGAHQLVKDEIASRGGTPLPAPSPDEMKAAHAAAREKEVSGPASKQDLIAAWSTSYRYSGKTEAKDKRIAAFATEMHRLLSTNKQPDKCGPGCQDAHKFLGMVDHDATPQDRELQRGITLSPAAAQRMFQPGKTMDMPVGSWTSDDKTADSYAKGGGKEGGAKAVAGKTKVVLHAAPGAKGLNISDMSIWKGENEVVTGGRFSVDNVQTEGGVMNVYLTQKDFSAH